MRAVPASACRQRVGDVIAVLEVVTFHRFFEVFIGCSVVAPMHRTSRHPLPLGSAKVAGDLSVRFMQHLENARERIEVLRGFLVGALELGRHHIAFVSDGLAVGLHVRDFGLDLRPVACKEPL